MQKIVASCLCLLLGVYGGQAFSESTVVDVNKSAIDADFQKILKSDPSYPMLLALHELDPDIYKVTRDIYQINQLDKVTRQLHLLVVQQRKTNQLLKARVGINN